MLPKKYHNQIIRLLSCFLLSSAALPAAEAKEVRLVAAGSRLTVTDPLNVVTNYSAGRRSQSDTPDTVRILALRVQFVKDLLKTTTGDGLFDLSSSSDYVIDRPPHDKHYFEQQLLALRNYFSTVSNGKLVLETQVLPSGSTDAYQLPQNMIYYSGEEDQKKQKQRWAELLRDAVLAARDQDAPLFSQYDAVIVFHAGVGKDFAFDFNETPFDIQSAFIDFQTLHETLGADWAAYPGIEVGNDVTIKEGIILPEMQNQKGYTLGLLGTATLLMGSQLGMPSLFNTETGRPGIGKWGLMDQGSYNFYGLIPAHPDAWTKIYMGWEEPVVVNSLEQAVIGSAGTHSAPHILKVPISSTEYFLLENRQEDVNGDGITYGRDENGVRVKFDSLGAIAVEEGLGVITRIDEYDYGLPGSGILIWHIDETEIMMGLASNSINNDPERRGVDLVECDGPQDIGQVYSMFTPGYGTEAGDYWDPYWADNLSHKYVNGEKPVEFSATSIPNSDANVGGKTHIRMDHFSDKDTLMTLSISSDFHRKGFPQYGGGFFNDGALTSFTTPAGVHALAAVSEGGDLYAWHTDGSKVLANDVSASVHDFAGRMTNYPRALIGSATLFMINRPLAAYDLIPALAGDELLTVDNLSELVVWSLVDADNDGFADVVARMGLGEEVTAGPLVLASPVAGGSILLGTQNGKGILLGVSDSELRKIADVQVSDRPITGMLADNGEFVFADSSGSVNFYILEAGVFRRIRQLQAIGGGDLTYLIRGKAADQSDQIYALTNDGVVTVINTNGQLIDTGHPAAAFRNVGVPALGDVDFDGVGELLFANRYVLNVTEPNGVPTLNFPYSFVQDVYPEIGSSPLWVQGVDDSYTIFAVGSLLHLLDSSCREVDGFPLSAGWNIQGSLLLWVNPDETLTIFCLSLNGFLNAWDTGIAVKKDGIWPRYGGDSRNSFSYLPTFQQVEQPKDVMPEKLVFCYPNPSADGRTFIRYTLNQSVEDVDIRIYDLSGSLVVDFRNNDALAGDHEVMWDVTPVQSGAYIARVEARSSSGPVVKFVKIAVVK
jgi:M6 family metalloprotease-like protein